MANHPCDLCEKNGYECWRCVWRHGENLNNQTCEHSRCIYNREEECMINAANRCGLNMDLLQKKEKGE